MKISSQKQKLLLIPGVLCNHELWQDLPGQLSAHFTVHYVDILQGENLHQMTAQVVNVLTEPQWLIGFSLGGWVAMEVAHLKPQMVQGLILISTSGGEITPKTREAMQQAITWLQQSDMKEFIQKSLPMYLSPENNKNPLITSKINHMMTTVGAKHVQQQYQAMLNLKQSFNYLPSLHCPTLIIRGQHEQRNPLEVHESLRNQIPNAQLKIIPNTAHFVPLEQPHALAKTIRLFVENTLS